MHGRDEGGLEEATLICVFLIAPLRAVCLGCYQVLACPILPGQPIFFIFFQESVVLGRYFVVWDYFGTRRMYAKPAYILTRLHLFSPF